MSHLPIQHKKRNYAGQGCQLADSRLKLYWQAKLRSIDSCQNGTCADHYQITNNVGSNTRSDIPPLQPGLKCLTHTRSQQSVYKKIHHSNEVQLTAVKPELPLTIITCPYRRLRYRLTDFGFLKLSADKLLLFK